MITRFSDDISVSNYILKFYIFSENREERIQENNIRQRGRPKQWFMSNLYLGLGDRRLSPSDKYQSGQ